MEKKVPLEKLTTDGAPAMTGRHSGFIAHCKGDTDFPQFLHYHCIIHQQAICAKITGFEHVMTFMKILNSQNSTAYSRCFWRSCQLNMATCSYTQKSNGSAGDKFCNISVTFE